MIVLSEVPLPPRMVATNPPNVRCERRLAADNETDAPLSLFLGDNRNRQKAEKHIRKHSRKETAMGL